MFDLDALDRAEAALTGRAPLRALAAHRLEERPVRQPEARGCPHLRLLASAGSEAARLESVQ